ncbi:hypothetical protein IEQ34_017772 [Dendrobium chrysotoxum]|uniref:Knr4/Smi1-like domain-containing protein n=1 Tax=Dendrobium chrysotoxum TaxID=161865 RepID=A0AAV7GCK4_DENCH|nr:hypothetical protein IEQ34_017772 [Dendrobium chrysotoxum]
MVDIDRRISALSPAAHAAALRRLSTRAASTSSFPSPTSLSACASLTPLAESILSHLCSSSVHILPGLSPSELTRAEAEFGFSFPPDLRAFISLGLPSGPGFPDWRSPSHLRPLLDLPAASISFQIAFPRVHSFWPKSSWGPRPNEPDEALRFARSALRRAPLLLPVLNRCYLPCLPALAGNPVFLVEDSRVTICALDLSDFFLSSFSPSLRLQRQLSAAEPRPPSPLDYASRRSLDSAARTPRWIEFWTEAASFDRRRRSSSSFSSSERFVDIREQRMSPPAWVGKYLERIGEILRDGGWRENDVAEMVEVAASGFFDNAGCGKDNVVAVDGEAVLDALLLKANRCSDSLRRAGWSSEEVSDVLGMDFRRSRNTCRPAVRLPKDIAAKVEKLADVVSRTS